MSNIRFSIIIPHYNVPSLLKRCLTSIPIRDDLEVIVVDDHSDIEYQEQLHLLEEVFSHVIFLFCDKNGGGGRARNIGMSKARGESFLFADADDFFNYCLNEILDKYVVCAYDVVYFNANYIDSVTYLPTTRLTSLKSAVNHYYKNNNMDSFKYEFGEPWCKLVDRKLIEKYNIKFEETPIHNDAKFSYLIGYYAKRVFFDNVALYTLANRTGSTINKVNDNKRIIRVKVFAEKNRFLFEHNISFFDYTMIYPFIWFLKNRDTSHLNTCFRIAKAQGFSKWFVIKKIINVKWKLFLRFDKLLIKTTKWLHNG